MKTKISIVAGLLAVLVYFGCKKSETVAPAATTPAAKDNYSSTGNFFAKNAIPAQYFTVNGTTGGSFTGKEGTKFTFPANVFVDQSNTPITGTVTLKLIELYNKSDMFFNGTVPVQNTGYPLHSGGEFYLAATFSGGIAGLAAGKKFIATMPKNQNDTLGAAKPFIISPLDSIPQNGNAWAPSTQDTLLTTATSYVWNGYTMGGTFGDSGVWINSDQNFSGVTNYGTVTAATTDSQSVYNTYVFIVFKIKAMMHVYYNYNNNNFPDPYTPLRYSATVVAVGVKNGTLYSSFTPITTSNGLNVNFTLQPTTTAAFETTLNTLN